MLLKILHGKKDLQFQKILCHQMRLLVFFLVKINDPIFGENSAEFITQILLSANNNIIGENPL